MQKKEKTYEEKIAQIEETIKALDDKDIALDKAIALYKDGKKLVEACNSELEGIEKELRVIEKDQDNE